SKALQRITLAGGDIMTHEGTAAKETADGLRVADVRFEHLRDALGIGADRPRLSWIVVNAPGGWRQAGYEIEAYWPGSQLREQTGRVDSDESVLIAWPFAPLTSRQQVIVRVRAWGADGAPSDWSAPAPAEAGLLHPGDWTAHFVTPDWDEDTSTPQPGPLLRHEFTVRAGVWRARGCMSRRLACTRPRSTAQLSAITS